MTAISDIVRIVRKGGIGIIPTDTLYGLVGSALSKKAVERIYKVRKRDTSKPLIVLISSVKDLKKFGVKNVLSSALHKIWDGKSGPVSVVLPCTSKKFEYVHRGTKSIAFRLPQNKELRDLLKKTGPLVAPSANISGQPPAETIAEAKKYFGTNVDFYLAGGRKKGKPSRIVSLVSGEPVILRK